MKRSSESKANFAGVSEDDIIRRIEDGEALAAIAESVGRARSTLSEWLNSDDARAERSARARASAAGAWDEKAEREIGEASDPFTLAKAKELAHHYRWRASKINPRQYGERQQVEYSGRLGIEQLVTASRQKPDAG
jgi:hypothetical protein